LLQSTPLLLKYLPFTEGYMSKLGTDGRIRCRVTIDRLESQVMKKGKGGCFLVGPSFLDSRAELHIPTHPLHASHAALPNLNFQISYYLTLIGPGSPHQLFNILFLIFST
jgi:hypothetical protein